MTADLTKQISTTPDRRECHDNCAPLVAVRTRVDTVEQSTRALFKKFDTLLWTVIGAQGVIITLLAGILLKK